MSKAIVKEDLPLIRDALKRSCFSPLNHARVEPPNLPSRCGQPWGSGCDHYQRGYGDLTQGLCLWDGVGVAGQDSWRLWGALQNGSPLFPLLGFGGAGSYLNPYLFWFPGSCHTRRLDPPPCWAGQLEELPRVGDCCSRCLDHPRPCVWGWRSSLSCRWDTCTRSSTSTRRSSRWEKREMKGMAC